MSTTWEFRKIAQLCLSYFYQYLKMTPKRITDFLFSLETSVNPNFKFMIKIKANPNVFTF